MIVWLVPQIGIRTSFLYIGLLKLGSPLLFQREEERKYMKKRKEYNLEWCDKCRVVFAFNARTGDGKRCPDCKGTLEHIGTHVSNGLPIQSRSPRMPEVKPLKK